MFENNISVADMEAFVARQGSRASKVFSVLGRSTDYMNAFASPIGQELLKDGLRFLDDKLALIVDQKASEQDIAQYKAMKAIMDSWAARVNVYLDNYKKVKQEGKGGKNGKASDI